MSIVPRIRQRLATAASIDSSRIYSATLPLGAALPAIVIFRVGGTPWGTHDPGPASVADVRWQFTCWGETYEQAYLTGEAVFAALDNWADNSGSVRVLHSRVANDLDGYDPDSRRHRRIVDALIAHEIGA